MSKGVEYRSKNILRRPHYKNVVHSTDSGITKAISSKEDQLLQQAIEKEKSTPKKQLLQYMKTVLNIQEYPYPEVRTQYLAFKDKQGNDINIRLKKHQNDFILQLSITGKRFEKKMWRGKEDLGFIEIHRDTKNNTLSYHNTIGKQEEIKKLRENQKKKDLSTQEREEIMKQEDELMCSKPLTDEVLSENLLPILQDHLTDYKTYKPEYKKRKKKILNNPEEYPYVHRFNQLLSLCPNRQTDSLYDINKAYTDENGDTILIQISLSDGGTIGYLRKKKGQNYYELGSHNDLFYDYYDNSFVGGLRSPEEIEDILSTCEKFILKDPEFNKQQNNQGNNR